MLNIILSVLIVIIIFVGILFIRALTHYYDDNVVEMINNITPCRLLVTGIFNDDVQETSITDFSKFENNGIVGLTLYYSRQPVTEEEKLINGKTVLFEHAVVYQVGGTWLWKVLSS